MNTFADHYFNPFYFYFNSLVNLLAAIVSGRQILSRTSVFLLTSSLYLDTTMSCANEAIFFNVVFKYLGYGPTPTGITRIIFRFSISTSATARTLSDGLSRVIKITMSCALERP